MSRKVVNTGSGLPTGIKDSAFKRMSQQLTEKIVAREFKAHAVWDVSGTSESPSIMRLHHESSGEPSFSDADVHRVDLGSSIILWLGGDKYAGTVVDYNETEILVGIGDDVYRIAHEDMEFEAQQFGPEVSQNMMEIQYIPQGSRFMMGGSNPKTYMVVGRSPNGDFTVAKNVTDTGEEMQLHKSTKVISV